MNIDDPEIMLLRERVKAAREEFEMAVMFHEVWKPAAYGKDLHERMGVSYATNAFHVVRDALRREMLLALMRLWDRNRKATSMEAIARILRDRPVIDILAADRMTRINIPEAEIQMKETLTQRADEVLLLIDTYSKGGSKFAIVDRLRDLRNERLAHRQIEVSSAAITDTHDEEIESFYQDTSTVVRLLLSLVEALAYDPQDAAHVYRHYATLFWAGLRGEKTEGHPNYRSPHSAPAI